MFSTEGLSENLLSHEQDASLSRQLDAAWSLALHGAEALGCQLCASIFLDHAHALVANPGHKKQFVNSVILLGMTNLLARLLRAADGVELTAKMVATDRGEGLVLSLSNGTRVRLVLPGPGAGRAERQRFAVEFSDAVLNAAASRGVTVSPIARAGKAGEQPGSTLPVMPRVSADNMLGARPSHATIAGTHES